MIDKGVVLLLPDGPINSAGSPLATSRSTPSSARKDVLPSPYVFVTFQTEIASSMPGTSY
jgi:hypothetical protein